MEPAFTSQQLRGTYDVHVRVEWKAVGATRGNIHRGLSLDKVEALFEQTCNRVVNNRLDQVVKVEVKARHKVLFMQRFENGERL